MKRALWAGALFAAAFAATAALAIGTQNGTSGSVVREDLFKRFFTWNDTQISTTSTVQGNAFRAVIPGSATVPAYGFSTISNVGFAAAAGNIYLCTDGVSCKGNMNAAGQFSAVSFAAAAASGQSALLLPAATYINFDTTNNATFMRSPASGIIESTGTFRPSTDNVYDLGAAGNGWKTATVIGNVTSGGAFVSNNTNSSAFLINGGGGRFAINNIPVIFNTAPTISSGFGTSPSVTSTVGTAAFTVNVGTGAVATSGVIGLPTATNGWHCNCADITTPGASLTRQTATGTTSCTVTNVTMATGTPVAWVASDILSCTAAAR